jgi:hypothetical protein
MNSMDEACLFAFKLKHQPEQRSCHPVDLTSSFCYKGSMTPAHTTGV